MIEFSFLDDMIELLNIIHSSKIGSLKFTTDFNKIENIVDNDRRKGIIKTYDEYVSDLFGLHGKTFPILE